MLTFKKQFLFGLASALVALELFLFFVWEHWWYVEKSAALNEESAKFFRLQIAFGVTTLALLVLAGGVVLRATKRRERALVERFRFFDLAPDMICIVGLDATLRQVNRAYCKVLGYEAAELLGKVFFDYIPQEEHEAAKAEMGKLLHGEAVYDYESRVCCKDGSVRWISWYCQPFIKDGLIYATGRDVTEIRATKAELRAVHEHLEETVATRTAALTVAGEDLREGELRQMMKEDLQRREFATELHDYVGQDLLACRFKLGQLRAGLAQDADLALVLEEGCYLLDSAIQSARSLVFDLSPPMLHDIGLASALGWLAERYARIYRVELRFDPRTKVDPLPETTRVLFYQAASELLTNAMKHAAPTHIALCCARSAHELVLTVQNDGKPFPPSSALTFGAKSGFGLANIRERLRHLGGTLDIRCADGTTSVAISLPITL